jgi:PBP1b-binding outer membrane lipoprotein LpoB
VRRLIGILILALLVAGCATNPTPTPVASVPTQAPTWTPQPTYTPNPTYTPFPTPTVLPPTATPAATVAHTPGTSQGQAPGYLHEGRHTVSLVSTARPQSA